MRIFGLIFVLINSFVFCHEIALVKYGGGGDWYANPSSLKNLIEFCNSNIGTNINEEYKVVELSSEELFNYPYVYITGHGNIVLEDDEVNNLRKYLLSGGGFLHIDDNYGLDAYVRREIKKIFPDREFLELGINHPIFHQTFKFDKGLPKIHEHDGKRPQAFGIFDKDNRIICLYTYETDLGDGWEDQEVHNNSKEIRLQALKMGSNIIEYVFSN